MEDTVRTLLIESGHPFNENLKVKLTKFGYFKISQAFEKGKVDIGLNNKTLKWYFGKHNGKITLNEPLSN